MMLSGYQAIFLGIFAYIYGNQKNILEDSPRFSYIIERLTLENGATIGVSLSIIGLILILNNLRMWIYSGFTIAPINGVDVMSYTFFVMGMQTFLNSFFFSMLNRK